MILKMLKEHYIKLLPTTVSLNTTIDKALALL